MLWDTATWRQTLSISTGHHSYPWEAAFSPGGAALAIAQDGVTLWDPRSGNHIAQLEAPPPQGEDGLGRCARDCHCVSFHPNGQNLASGDGPLIRLHNVNSRELIGTLSGHSNSVWALCYDGSGTTLASAGDDDTVRLWDATSGAPLAILTGHQGIVRRLAFVDSGKLLASGGTWDGTIRLWDVKARSPKETVNGHYGTISSVAFAPSGEQFASGSDDGTIRIWDRKTGRPLAVLGPLGRTYVSRIAYHPGGQLLAAAGGHDNPARVWDIPSRQVVATIPTDGSSWSVAFSPDGDYLAVGGVGEVRIWDVTKKSPNSRLVGHRGAVVEDVAFRPKAKELLTGGRDGSVLRWDLLTGRHEEVSKSEGYVTCLGFSRDGSVFASAHDNGRISLFNSADWSKTADTRVHDGTVHGLHISPDATTLASAGADGTARLWKITSMEAMAVLEGHKGTISAVAFDPGGTSLLTAGSDAALQLWDVPRSPSATTLPNTGVRQGAWRSAGTTPLPWVAQVMRSNSGNLVKARPRAQCVAIPSPSRT